MKQLSILLLLVTFRLVTFGQVYQEMPQYGYRANRMAFDSTLQIPTFCGVPTLRSLVKANKNGAIAFDSCNNKLYQYNPKTLTWSEISGGGNDTTKIPYVGANKNVDIDTFSLTLKINKYKKSAQPTYQEGVVWYDSTQKSLAFYNDANYSPVFVGENIVLKVYNNTGSTIAKGSAVYIKNGGTFTYPNVALARADSVSTSAVIGLMNASTPSGSIGYVTSTGIITGVNTGAISEGTILYLSPYASGQLMNTIPPTGYVVQVGVVSHSNSLNGTIFTKQTTPLAISASTIVGTLAVNQGGTGSATQNFVDLTNSQSIGGQKTFTSNIKIPNSGSQLILQVNADQSVTGMPTSTYPSPAELIYVKGVTSGIQSQINGKLNISDTSSMLSNYRTSINEKLNATDTASLSNRIEKKQSNLDLLQLMSYGIKAEPYGVTLANMTGQQGLTTNRFYLYPFNWNVSDTLKGISFFMRSAFTNTATNYNGVAIYSLSGGTLNRIVFTANNGAFWNTTINTWVVQSITPTFLAKGLYFIGYQFSGSGTPTIGSGDPLVVASTQSPSDPPNTSTINANGIKFSTFILNATATPPTSIAMSATTAVVNVPYFLFF